MPSNIQKVIQKLAKPTKGLSGRRVPGMPWRPKKRPRAIQLSAADKLARRQKREQKREDVKEFLASTKELIWERAKMMAEKDGTHSAKYWVRQIQHEARTSKADRKPTLYNAMVSQELRKINQGT